MNNYISYNIFKQENTINLPLNHEEGQHNLSSEIIPYIHKLILLCEEKGFFIKILNRATVICKSLINDLSFDITATHEAMKSANFSHPNFGLAFGVGIYESSTLGHLKYLDHQSFYDKVGKLGESIGLKWAANHEVLKSLRYFELRPEWALNMDDKEMNNELYKRKQANLSLLV